MPDIVINDAAILDLIRHPESRLAHFVERQAERVVTKAKDNLSMPYPPSGTPGGPPAMRSGQLMGSIHRLGASLGTEGIVVDIIADAENEGHLYGITLRQPGRGGGYIFIDDHDLQTLVE